MVEENSINNKYGEETPILDNTRAEVNLDGGKIIEERSKKVFGFFKKSNLWVLGILIIVIIFGAYIRSMPMHDHDPSTPGSQPGLWDITTNTWTLGPDLDPWLFTRYAKTIVEQGSLPKIDLMRNVPLGFDTTTETRVLPYMIAQTYYFINVFGDYPAEFAAVIFPVFMFILTIIVFFLFVREVFIKKSKKSIIKANIIALISTFFMTVIPIFLSRTVAGIPEKESAGFFFMFLAFYLFLKAWKSDKLKNSMILGICAGISTALMGLIWGGVIYVFLTIGISSLIAFILNQVRKKETIVYSLWIFFSFLLMLLFSNRFTLRGLALSLDSGVAFLVLLIFIVHLLLWGTKIKDLKLLNKIKLPKNITSIIITLILGIFIVVIFLGPNFIFSKIDAINKALFNPVTGRWGTTVAENRQPYFVEWASNFGPYIKNIPILFWMFFVGSVVLFKDMFRKIKKKDNLILTGFFILFFFGLVFSRYSESAIFNGENFISKLFYFSTTLLLIGFIVYYYIKYKKQKNDSFEKTDFGLIFIFALLIFTLFTIRGAVRLIMVLGPIAPIFVGYLIIRSVETFARTKDETWKIVIGAVVILVLLLSIFSFWTFYKQVRVQSYNFVPSSYNQQWQKAMKWVRDETPENSVFAHWWDYGYWLQSIGNRPTVLDGGNTITYWNYLMGRLVLTGDNQFDATEFLYNHDTDYLLIDSTDIGKYGAFSSIGSDANFDRFSWVNTFLLDESQTQETQNQTIFVYPGGGVLDEDLIIQENGKDVLLPNQKSGVGAIIIPSATVGDTTEFMQPYAIMVYQGTQYEVNLRYLAVDNQLIDFESGIEACAFVFPKLIVQNNQINQNPFGAIMYLSPRLMRGMLAQVYILNDPFKKFTNFPLIHTQDSLVVESLKQQGMPVQDFIYYQGIQGPIKIWKVIYSGDEEKKQEYLDKSYAKYLDWKL